MLLPARRQEHQAKLLAHVPCISVFVRSHLGNPHCTCHVPRRRRCGCSLWSPSWASEWSQDVGLTTCCALQGGRWDFRAGYAALADRSAQSTTVGNNEHALLSPNSRTCAKGHGQAPARGALPRARRHPRGHTAVRHPQHEAQLGGAARLQARALAGWVLAGMWAVV